MTILAIAPLARGDAWVDQSLGGSYDEIELRIPDGAIPPGAATAEIVAGAGGPAAVRVRFRMPRTGDAVVRIPFQFAPRPDADSASVVAHVTGAHGAVYRKRVGLGDSPEHRQSPNSALFFGDAEGLGRFLEAVRLGPRPGDADPPLGEVRLRPIESIDASDCRSLARAVVIVAYRPGTRAEALVRCAARGAHVVIVGPNVTRDLQPYQTPVNWGAGSLALAPSLEASVPAVHEILSAGPNSVRILGGRILSQLAYSRPADRDDGEGVSDGVVLACLLVYVLVLGPLGWFVLRRRNTLLSWLYFPAVALAATVALAIATFASDGRLDRASVERATLAAPDGTGISLVALRLFGAHTRTFTVRAPYVDANLVQVARPFRFGSPFTTPAGAVQITHDLTRGRIEASGVAVSRFSEAGLSWVEPAEVAVPRLVADGPSRIVLYAAADAPTRAAVVITRAGWAYARALAPGERRVLPLRPSTDDRERVAKLGPAFETVTSAVSFGEELPMHTALVMSEVQDGAGRAVRLWPRVPTDTRSLRLLVGGLP